MKAKYPDDGGDHMLFIFVISAIVFSYEDASLIFPLRISLTWKLLASLALLAVTFKNEIFLITAGGRYFAPQLPRWLSLYSSALYNVVVSALFLSLFKDVIWLVSKFLLHMTFPASAASVTVITIAVLLSAYGTWEAVKEPDVEVHEVHIKGLAPEFDGLKAVVLVDLHVGTVNRRNIIQAIVNKTNSLSPDLILMPGDFVDGSVEQRAYDLEPLRQLKAPFGVYGSAGNHDYYSGYASWMEKLSEFGIQMLENRHVVLRSGDAELTVAGVTDEAGVPDIDTALTGAPSSPVLLMAHRPLSARKYAAHGVALQVSGHTHGGMMPILGTLVARMNGGFVRGWYDVDGMKLFNSPGTLIWSGFPMRVFDPSEISLITIRR